MMRAGGVLNVSVFERKTHCQWLCVIEISGRFDRAQLHGSVGSADNQAAVFHPVHLLHGYADCRGSPFIFQHCQPIVDQSVIPCLLHERRDFFRFPQHGDDQVDQVSGKNVHGAAFEL